MSAGWPAGFPHRGPADDAAAAGGPALLGVDRAMRDVDREHQALGEESEVVVARGVDDRAESFQYRPARVEVGALGEGDAVEPGGGPLTDRHNMVFAQPDAAELSAKLLAS